MSYSASNPLLCSHSCTSAGSEFWSRWRVTFFTKLRSFGPPALPWETRNCSSRRNSSCLPNSETTGKNVQYSKPIRRSGKVARWLPWSSLVTLKLVFNVSSDYQGSHPDDIFLHTDTTQIFLVNTVGPQRYLTSDVQFIDKTFCTFIQIWPHCSQWSNCCLILYFVI